MGKDGSMTDHRKPVDALLDNLVYAPLGFLTEASSLAPALAEKGRVQVANARMMGMFAVQMGQAEAVKHIGGIEAQMRNLLVGFGLAPPDVMIDDVPESQDVEVPITVVDEAPEPVVETETAPDVDDLAIPDYDSLAASQVVSRLAGLRPAELIDVQSYERLTRGRKTILGKIAQLQAK